MFEPHKVAYRHPKYKTAYRVKNWSEYEKSLRNRGDITVWFSQEAIEAWTPQKNGKRGGQPVYSNIAIETSLSLRLIFQLPLRQTEGFLGYYLQSHVENAFYRFKRIIGGRLRSKRDEAQEREALIGCSILNKMLEIGRPVSYQVC
jgi:hypothetical protein